MEEVEEVEDLDVVKEGLEEILEVEVEEEEEEEEAVKYSKPKGET